MAHLTAGDILPIAAGGEVTYGTEASTLAYYADVKGDSGSITIMDTPSPYLAWRNGSRDYDPDDYVTQQKLAGFKDVVELRDMNGWDGIFLFGLGVSGELPSRTVQIGITGGAGFKYVGCKTDELTIKAEAPGAVVSFEETVLASYVEDISTAEVTVASGKHAVQWIGPTFIGVSPIYPQSFEIRIKNNLERVLAYDSAKGGSYTADLPAGRREIEIDMEIWRQDLQDIIDSRDITKPGNIQIRLGTSVPKKLTLTGVATVSDGNISPLVQDKQRTTLRFRATSISIANL